MSTTFTKSVSFQIKTADATIVWNLDIQESSLSGTASYTPTGGELLTFNNLSGTVQYQGGIYNGPFTIDITSGADKQGDTISAGLTANADWNGGTGGYLVVYNGGYDGPLVPMTTPMTLVPQTA